MVVWGGAQSAPSNSNTCGLFDFGWTNSGVFGTEFLDLAIDSKLRGCDIAKVRIGDGIAGCRIRDRAVLLQRKTKRVQFDIVELARKMLLAWLERRGSTFNDFAFPSHNDYQEHVSTRQYARLGREMIIGIGVH